MTFHSLIDMIKPISVIKQDVSGDAERTRGLGNKNGEEKTNSEKTRSKKRRATGFPPMLPQYFLLAWLLVDGMKYSRALM